MSINPNTARILEFIRKSPDGIARWDLLFAFIGDGDEERVQHLLDSNLIESAEDALTSDGLSFWHVAYQLTIHGADALSEYQRAQDKVAQDIADQNAKEERMLLEKRKDRRIATRRFYLGLFIGWILGAFTPDDAWNLLSEQLPKLWNLIQGLLPF